MAIDVLLNTDDIVVFGPPDVVEVLVDIGPSGTRGSQVFVGVGDPNLIEIGQTPILNDLYINTSPGADYGYLYQYVSEPGGDTWIQILKINPTIYSENHLTTYTDGAASIVIPIADIVTVTGTPLTAENFNVQYSIAHDNPVATGMAVPTLVGTNLTINFTAAEYSGSTWSDFSGEVVTHLFITIVAGVAEES
jgi:hypothetical protein